MNSNQEEEEVCIFYFIKAQLVAQLLANTVDLIDTRKNVLLWCVIQMSKGMLGYVVAAKEQKGQKKILRKVCKYMEFNKYYKIFLIIVNKNLYNTM